MPFCFFPLGECFHLLLPTLLFPSLVYLDLFVYFIPIQCLFSFWAAVLNYLIVVLFFFSCLLLLLSSL